MPRYDKPALRAAMEKKHGVSDDMGLKQARLFDAYQDEDFLRRWVAAHETPPARETCCPC